MHVAVVAGAASGDGVPAGPQRNATGAVSGNVEVCRFWPGARGIDAFAAGTAMKLTVHLIETGWRVQLRHC